MLGHFILITLKYLKKVSKIFQEAMFVNEINKSSKSLKQIVHNISALMLEKPVNRMNY